MKYLIHRTACSDDIFAVEVFEEKKHGHEGCGFYFDDVEYSSETRDLKFSIKENPSGHIPFAPEKIPDEEWEQLSTNFSDVPKMSEIKEYEEWKSEKKESSEE